ncbi:MAG: protein kinase [Elusimicrobia bacterium]|nr:protein kinase [Elusimicrobiota bacterium]
MFIAQSALLALVLALPAQAGTGSLYRAKTASAQEAIRDGNWGAAESAAREAQKLSPAEHLAYPLRAMALSMLERDGEAVAEIRTAIRMHPKASGLHSVHAFVLNRARLFKDAEKSVDSSIAGRPNSPWAWYQLAHAQAGVGDRDGSLRSLAQAAAFSSERFGGRLERAKGTRGRRDLLALFEADPALDACFYVFRAPRRWSRRDSQLQLACALAVLAALFLFRRRLGGLLAAWAGEPVSSRSTTPIMGLPGPAAEGPKTPPQLPTGYRIVRQIGVGGMGAVFEAEDLALERRVAVKRLQDDIRDDPGERERFLREARTVAKLRHPSIIEIHAIVEHEGEVFLVFEYLEGRTLDALIAERKRLPVREAGRILGQICSALAYAHGRGVIHRDLKPANIMLLDDGRVKVMDFGIAGGAREGRTRRSMAETAAGTPPYMAPEAEAGVVRPESDLYSLAVCLYQMLAGERPFHGSGAGMLVRKREMRFEPVSKKVPGLAAALDLFFGRALQGDPEKRPVTAAEFESEFRIAAGL